MSEFIDKLHLEGVSIEENKNMRAFGDSRADGRIRINTSKGDVVNTVIHELLHVDDFNKSEERVQKQTFQIEKKMDLGEMGALLLEASQAQDPVPPRVVVHTEAGNVISGKIK